MLCLIALLGFSLAMDIETIRQKELPDMPPHIACAWIIQESSGNANAYSDTLDRGLLQISERYEPYFTQKFWGDAPFDVWDAKDNAIMAFRYIRYLHDIFGNWHDALAAYNGGWNLEIGDGYAKKLMRQWAEYNTLKDMEEVASFKTPKGNTSFYFRWLLLFPSRRDEEWRIALDTY